MKKIKTNDLVNKILIIFLIIQPIFDIKFFYNSISTLIRVIIIFALFLYYFFCSKDKRKYFLLLYPLLIGIYFIFHHINASCFTSLVAKNFYYSVLKEALYFVKMLSPFLLIYCLYKSNLSNKDIIQVIKFLSIIISLVIIISNLFGFSYGNYSDVKIKANFFEWFNPNSSYVYQDLASKGLFEYGNQIGAILIMFLPFVIWLSLYKRKLTDWLIVALNIFALILLCTKVSVFGVLIVVIYTLFTCCFVNFVNKKSFSIRLYVPIGIIILIYSILLPINPMLNRLEERKIIETSSENFSNSYFENNITDNNISLENNYNVDLETSNQEDTSTNFTDNKVSSEYMINFIENNYKIKQLNEHFLFESYPYKYDPEFWYNFLQNDTSLTTDYRYIEIAMVKRVVQINNNKMDKWFGITNTRVQNIFNIERDFIVQYYAIGIIGLLIVFAPYFIILGIFAYKLFISLCKKQLMKPNNSFNIIKLLAFITILFLFVISYMSGNLLNSLGFTIYFTLAFGLLINTDSTY